MKKFLVLLMASAIILTSGMVFAGDGQFPVVYNVTLTTADTEYSQALGKGVKKITCQCRTTDKIMRYAYVTGKVATPTAPYMTLQSNDVYKEDDLSTKRDLVLYLASPDGSVVAEICVWR